MEDKKNAEKKDCNNSPVETLVINRSGFTLIETIIAILIVSILIGIPVLSKMECFEKTRGMGYESKWTLLGGCKIQIKENQWIPLERYRHVEK